jgi:molybdopterin-guanine dinucleotide biosynthesis protein A
VAKPRSPAVRAAILAGGRARRFGGAKATVELAGRHLIEYPLEAARVAGLAPFVVAKPASALPSLDCEVVLEPPAPFHPLVGVLTALEATPGPVVVVGCDMPFVTGSLLAWLARLQPPAVASVADRIEPLLGLYGQSARGHLERSLADEAPMRDAVALLRPLIAVSELERFGTPKRLVFSVNSRDELSLAERMLEE